MTDKQLFEAVTDGDCNYLTALLSRKKSKSCPKDKGGQTLLHVAAALGFVQIAEILLQNNKTGCLRDQDEVFGFTPLHTACFFNQTNMAQFLLEKEDRNCFQELLAIKDNSDWTCLHHVAKNGNSKLCLELLKNGASPLAINKVGRQPVHYAASEGHVTTLEMLLDHMGPSAIREPVADENGMNILHCAVRKNQQAVFFLLKARVFPPNLKCEIIKNQENNTKEGPSLAEDVARTTGHKALGSLTQDYRQVYESWVRDMQVVEPLDRMKLCIIGEPGVGKSCLRMSLRRGVLQAALLPDLPSANEEHVEHSAGIVINDVQIDSNNFVIWDFAGQLDNYVTHQLFMTTESTMYVAVVNICHDPDQLRLQLMKWLKLIKVRNIGLLQYVTDPQYPKRDMYPLSQPTIASASDLQRGTTFTAREDLSEHLQFRRLTALPTKVTESEKRDEKWPQKIPLVLVGSHYDILQQSKTQEEIDKVLAALNAMADGLRTLFWPFLDIFPQVVPINCLKARGEDMQRLKSTLDNIRLSGVRYPRVIKTAALRIAQYANATKDSEDKVISWNKARSLILESNGILSDPQITFILRELHNTGHIVYLHKGPLGDEIFTDPTWLCGDILGPLLAPKNFKVATLSKGQNVSSGEITEKEFQDSLANRKAQYERIEKLLTHLQLCWKDNANSTYIFPGFIECQFDRQAHWSESPGAEQYTEYVGRSFLCSSQTDLLAPGFVSRLAVYMQGHSLKVAVRRDCFLVEDPDKIQCLVELARESTSLEVRARTVPQHAEACIKLLEKLQYSMSQLIRLACPNIFINLLILSVADMRKHRWPAHAYKLQDVLDAEKNNTFLVHPKSGEQESTLDLLYCGNPNCKKDRSGEKTRITYLPESLIKQLELLLASEDNAKDWKALTELRGFGDYVQILSHKEPFHVKYLLRKWGENPRWTLESLIAALDSMDRNDVALYVKAFFLPKDI
jgi:GTPase SAR1 family protein